ncbi:MAG: aminotransferase class IV [Candidatus Limivivens sp.]|nr:aminotransferase class IV [Candidatus Limivivens sp.]
MENLGYYNGKYDLIENMMIPMTDRVCYFGDGVYDATYAHNHKIFDLKNHLDRFFNSAGLMRINIGMSKEEVGAILEEMVQKVDAQTQFVYWQITRGSEIRNHAWADGIKGNLWVMIKPASITDLSRKIKVISKEDTRFLHCNVKTLNLLPSVLAAKEAEEAGCAECIFHRGEIVTECAHSNVSILKNGVLKTHPTDHLILPGIARIHLIAMCKELGVPVDECDYTMQELMDADEVIVHSSGTFAVGVESVDGIPVGGRAPELLKKIQDALTAEFLAATKAD